jgi:hypothetical protein
VGVVALTLAVLTACGGAELHTREVRERAMARVEAELLGRIQGAWIVDVRATRAQEAANRGDEIRAETWWLVGVIWGWRIVDDRACPASNMTLDYTTEQPGCFRLVIGDVSSSGFYLGFTTEQAGESDHVSGPARFDGPSRFCHELEGRRTCFRRATPHELDWLVPVDRARELAACTRPATAQEWVLPDKVGQMEAREQAALDTDGRSERHRTQTGAPQDHDLSATTAQDLPNSFYVPRGAGCFLTVEALRSDGETPRADQMRTDISGDWIPSGNLRAGRVNRHVRVTPDEYCWIPNRSGAPEWRCSAWEIHASQTAIFSLTLQREFGRTWYIQLHEGRLCTMRNAWIECYERGAEAKSSLQAR